MRLSIIVPVYNVGQFVRHCLQSLLQQGLEDYEVLLVNDASTDNSRGICSEWCQEHPEFHLINHPKNMGLSAARNTGINVAQGEYITFVDSDDFLAPQTLSQNMQLMSEADVLEYPVQVYHLSKTEYRWAPQLTETDFQGWMLQDGHMHCYAWNKIYRRSLWSEARFPEGRYYEDILCIPEILSRARVIKGSQVGLYYYCYRRGSISTAPNLRVLTDYVLAHQALLQMPVNAHNRKLYLQAKNAEIEYRKAGGKEHLLQHRYINPLGGLTLKESLKAVLNDLHII